MIKEPSYTITLLMDAAKQIELLDRAGKVLLARVETMHIMKGIKSTDGYPFRDSEQWSVSDRIARHVQELREDDPDTGIAAEINRIKPMKATVAEGNFLKRLAEHRGDRLSVEIVPLSKTELKALGKKATRRMPMRRTGKKKG